VKIHFYNQYGKIPFPYQKISKKLNETCSKIIGIEHEVNVILVDLEHIQQINQQFRHLDYPTDVISFEDKVENYLGDIFICVDKVIEQAKSYQHSKEREYAFLLCHGLLHLSGYDHMTPEQEAEMFSLQEQLLEKSGYQRR